MSSVLLSWVQGMPWKMQSILLSGLRAPDSPAPNVKKVCRWMRGTVQNNADPSKGYMEKQKLSTKLVEACVNELEYLSCHFVHHFADALRVIAIYHQEEDIRAFAYNVHFQIAVEIFHFKPEEDKAFVERHVDKPKRRVFETSNQPDTSQPETRPYFLLAQAKEMQRDPRY